MRALRSALLLALLVTAAAPAAPGAGAQVGPARDAWAEVHAGSELERYLRTLQLVRGREEPYPWSIRGFSPRELERVAVAADDGHPWDGRFDLTPASAGEDGIRVAGPRFATILNRGFPLGAHDDGPLWAGRGLTAAVEAGGVVRWGPLSASVQPVAFWAQNAPFEVASARPRSLDAPQRFGESTYARLDAGESWIRADLPWVAAGISSAGMTWGPAERFPLAMGTSGPGFTHAFLGTGTPQNLWIGDLHGRLVWGHLEESAWSPPSEYSGRRFASSAVVVFRPRWPPGLELGGTRFFHLPWRDDGPVRRDFLRPFEALTKVRIGLHDRDEGIDATENQLASAFFRWIWPEGGLEVYGELYREDHSVDLRDVLVQPDHDLASTLGLRKGWNRDDGDIWVLEMEVMDSKITHIERLRHQTTPYGHSKLRQGHTHRGQFLGSAAALGGEGLSIALDRYHADGRWTLRAERTLQRDADLRSGRDGGHARDVLYTVTAEALAFRGPWEVVGELTGAWNLNRGLEGDHTNLRVAVSARWRGP